MKLVVLLAVFCYTSAQDGKSVEQLIGTIFTKPTSAPTETKNSLNLQPGGGTTGDGSKKCECVPYYLCENGTVIVNGVGLIDIRIDDGPCNYLAVCCEPPDKRKPDDPIKPPAEKSRGCGNRNPEGVGFRITGGKDNEAQFGEFNWMLAVLREESVEGNPQKLLVYQCGASLINPQVALTVAHWVSAKDKQFKVRAGEWDTQTKNELYPHQDRDVASIKMHPEFDSGALTFDYALLFLSSPFDIAENVDVVCLPPPDRELFGGTRCFASGWGKDVFGKEGKYQVILKKIDLPVVDKPACQISLRQTRVGEHFLLHHTLMCAGGEEGKDTCKGDGGSPLVCPIPGHPGRYEQHGIVSWGIGCGTGGTPGVYADVVKAYNWIEEELKKRNIDTSSYKP